MSKQLIHPLHCSRTGIPIGHLNLIVSAGHMPYLSHWDEQVAYHPLFSLNQQELVNFMRDEWNRLAKVAADETITEYESSNLRVGFVALLYSLGSIRQDQGIVILPSLGIVQSNLESCIALAYWKNYLDSKRFQFPEYHFSRINRNADLSNIGDYLADCWDKKAEYEAGISDKQEQEKARLAEKAIVAIRNTYLKPPGKKLLWQWVEGYLPNKWKPDAEGWLRTLFLSTISKSLDFHIDDINMMEEIIVSECPIGNSIMFAVRERINEIKKGYGEHYDHFTIEESGLEFIDSLKEEHASIPEPKQEDFKTKGQFFVARAKWQLANPSPMERKQASDLENARAKMIKKEDL